MNGSKKKHCFREWKDVLYQIIFEADTPGGKAFDLLLLCAILLSVVAVLLESVSSVRESCLPVLLTIEWGFTVLFTLEYVFRLICARNSLKYALSLFGVVDLLAIIPAFAGLYFTGVHPLRMIRVIRMLRVFRILKLGRYIRQADFLISALKASKEKITIFLGVVLSVVLIMGTVMYLVEGEESGFTSIPRSIYWAIVTMTTVGYGDIAPSTVIGQAFAAVVMIFGYGIIAVPTGIFSVELIAAMKKHADFRECKNCKKTGHEADSSCCRFCGARLGSELKESSRGKNG